MSGLLHDIGNLVHEVTRMSIQDDEKVTHEEDLNKKEENMVTDEDTDNDELLDLISGAHPLLKLL